MLVCWGGVEVLRSNQMRSGWRRARERGQWRAQRARAHWSRDLSGPRIGHKRERRLSERVGTRTRAVQTCRWAHVKRRMRPAERFKFYFFLSHSAHEGMINCLPPPYSGPSRAVCCEERTPQLRKPANKSGEKDKNAQRRALNRSASTL